MNRKKPTGHEINGFSVHVGNKNEYPAGTRCNWKLSPRAKSCRLTRSRATAPAMSKMFGQLFDLRNKQIAPTRIRTLSANGSVSITNERYLAGTMRPSCTGAKITSQPTPATIVATNATMSARMSLSI